ncbi:MAG: enoyl-CoA hydratase-related protein [Acidobacteriota bacterium]
MTYQTILLSYEKSVAKITLNRPQVLNALDAQMADDLNAVFDELAKRDDIRAVIVTGAERAFCVGGDVKQMSQFAESEPTKRIVAPLEACHNFILKMRNLAKPIIAAINGVAAGAGFNIALACDARIAAESAKFSQAFVRVGLVPDCGGTFFLPRIVGAAKAMEMMLTGELIDAEQAKQLGIVNVVVQDSELASSVQFFAEQAAELPTAAIGRLKRLLNASSSSSLTEQLALEAEMQIESVGTEDFVEGVRAFAEKRTPKFQGR